MNIIKTKLIKVVYYKEPKEILYEVEENINLETLLWECGRSDGTDITNTQPCIIDGMSQRHYEHFSQFKKIVNEDYQRLQDRGYWSDKVLIEQVEPSDETPDYLVYTCKEDELNQEVIRHDIKNQVFNQRSVGWEWVRKEQLDEEGVKMFQEKQKEKEERIKEMEEQLR